MEIKPEICRDFLLPWHVCHSCMRDIWPAMPDTSNVLIDRLLSGRRCSAEDRNSFLNVPSIMYLKDTLFSVSSVWTRVNSPWGEIEIRNWQYYCITFWSYYWDSDIAYHRAPSPPALEPRVWPSSSLYCLQAGGVISQDCKGFDQPAVVQWSPCIWISSICFIQWEGKGYSSSKTGWSLCIYRDEYPPLSVVLMTLDARLGFVFKNYPVVSRISSLSSVSAHQSAGLENCSAAGRRPSVQISPACWRCIQSPTSNLTQTWHRFFTQLSNPSFHWDTM